MLDWKTQKPPALYWTPFILVLRLSDSRAGKGTCFWSRAHHMLWPQREEMFGTLEDPILNMPSLRHKGVMGFWCVPEASY
jgi:hypothetical protein